MNDIAQKTREFRRRVERVLRRLPYPWRGQPVPDAYAEEVMDGVTPELVLELVRQFARLEGQARMTVGAAGWKTQLDGGVYTVEQALEFCRSHLGGGPCRQGSGDRFHCEEPTACAVGGRCCGCPFTHAPDDQRGHEYAALNQAVSFHRIPPEQSELQTAP